MVDISASHDNSYYCSMMIEQFLRKAKRNQYHSVRISIAFLYLYSDYSYRNHQVNGLY